MTAETELAELKESIEALRVKWRELRVAEQIDNNQDIYRTLCAIRHPLADVCRKVGIEL